MLPKGWQHRPLSECAKFVSGGTPNKETPEFWGGGFPWITAKDMKSIRLNGAGLTLTDAGKEEARVVPAGSVLVLTRGMTLLKDLPICIANTEVAFNQDVKALLPTEGIDSDFLANQMIANKREILGLVDTAGHGTGRLDTELLKEFEIAIAPFDEQERIGEVLAVWDSAIAISERILVNSRKQRLGLIGKLLRFPTPASEADERERIGGVPPSVQAGIPKLPRKPAGWTKVRLGKHLTEVSRPISLKDDERYTLVTVKRSRGGIVSRGELKGKDIKTPSQFKVKKGDFLISKRQIVHGACGVVPSELDTAIVSNEYAILKSDGKIDLNFLRYLSESIYFQQTCFHSSIGVHVEKMIFKTDRWLSYPFNIPPLQLQRKIVRALDKASRRVELETMRVEILKREKTALMQQLLAGKRRIKLSKK